METRPARRPTFIAMAVLALLASRFAAPAIGEAAPSEAGRAWRGEIGQAAADGFAPAACTVPMRAPALLALADWPLDTDRAVCRAGSTMTGAVGNDPTIEDVADHPPVVPVVVGTAVGEAEATATAVAPLTLADADAVVGEDELAGLRGGFELPGGLSMSFGLERLVYINGVLQSTTRLTIAELGDLIGRGAAAGAAVQSGAAASQPAQPAQDVPAAHSAQAPVQTPSSPSSATPPTLEVGSTVMAIQTGTGNTLAADVLAASALGTIIQNSLNDQRIQIITTVNARVNSMELLRADRLGESIRRSMDLR